MALDQEQEHSEDKEMSFFDHIETLRKHLFRSAVSVALFTILGFFYIEYIFDQIILGPLRNDFISYRLLCNLSHYLYGNDQFCINNLNIVLVNLEMSGQFMISFRLAFLTGIILSMPYLVWQLWKFLRPALTLRERSKTRGFTFYITFLFMAGVCFGYFVLCPISINFLSNYTLSSMIENKYTVSSIVSFLSLIVLGTGLIFELPIVMYFLARIGIISSEFLKKYRKHSFVVILIVAAIATPPDVVSQITLTVPLYSLFELGIVIVKRVEKQKEIDNA
jgi:sec-independent protein translocase protein TatC